MWIVGGAIRDARLRRPIGDVDLAVASGEEGLARALAAVGWGKAFSLSARADLPVWRVASPDGTIDVARFTAGATIEDDLARRDFTVNAMARAAGSRRTLDPFGGRADLARGVVRAVARKNLAEDPLRMLRAYRIAAGRGWRIDPRTRRWIAAGAAALARVAAERIRDETFRLFGARDPEAIGWAAADGVLAAALGVPIGRSAVAAARAFPRRSAARTPEDAAVARLAILLRVAGIDSGSIAHRLAARKFPRAQAREIARTAAFLDRVLSGSDVWRALFESRAALGPRLRALRDAARTPAERRRARQAAAVARRARTGEPPVTGADVARWFGIAPGPEIGVRLDDARWRWFRREWRSREEIRAGIASND